MFLYISCSKEIDFQVTLSIQYVTLNASLTDRLLFLGVINLSESRFAIYHHPASLIATLDFIASLILFHKQDQSFSQFQLDNWVIVFS